MDLNSEIGTILCDDDFNCYSIDSGKILIVTSGNGSVGNFIKNITAEAKPEKVIVLDRVFNGNDQEKANLSIQLRDAGVDFRTV